MKSTKNKYCSLLSAFHAHLISGLLCLSLLNMISGGQALAQGYITVTFYPDSNPELTSVDGFVVSSSSPNSFLSKRAELGSVANDFSTSGRIARLVASNSTNEYQIIHRGILIFDTSSLPDSAIITSATLSLYGVGKGNGLLSDAHAALSCRVDSNNKHRTHIGRLCKTG